METSKNKLYVIATPIGNLNDVSNNMIHTINNLDYLFCEDTRTTGLLLEKIEITNKPKLISYHKFNEEEKLNSLINLINLNKCGIVSDAGYPSINDPGNILINKCHSLGIKVEVIDGPCSIIHAIVQSGFCNNGFIFLGFLMRDETKIKKQIESYYHLNQPIVFLESIHRINKTVSFLKNEYPNDLVYIGRELTKSFEEYHISYAKQIPFITEKGELVLIIKPIIKEIEEINLNGEIEELISFGLKAKDACKYLAKKHNLKPNKLFDDYLNHQKVLKINKNQ